MKEKVENNIIEIANKCGFNLSIVEYQNTDCLIFSKYSTYGQDFSFEINVNKSCVLDDIWRELNSYYEDYDPSYEAYLWLDDEGHGKNGAPYEMIDVYNDMKECEKNIKKLVDAVLKEIE